MSKEKTIDDLHKEKDKLWKKYWKICDEITKKEIKKYDFEGKYVKIYGSVSGDNPIYMHVESNSISYKPFDTQKDRYIYLKGHGFKSYLGPYTDSNNVRYSQWWDEYVKLADFLKYEEMRKALKLQPEDFSFNCNSIIEITKEEYYNEFKKVIGGMFDAFYKYEEGDCEIELDQEKMRQYYEDTKVMKD